MDKLTLYYVFKQLLLLICQLSGNHCNLVFPCDCYTQVCSLFLVLMAEFEAIQMCSSNPEKLHPILMIKYFLILL